MNYEDIQTFKERLRSGIAASDAASLQKKLLEEVADLRHYIELRLINQPYHYTGDTHMETNTTKRWVDPPAGWQYGFPAVWDSAVEVDMMKWLLSKGYPAALVKELGEYFYVRQWEYTEGDT